MKKAIIWMVAIVLAIFALVACADAETSEGNGFQVVNPVHECADQKEMAADTQIDIDAPENAEQVVYSYIEDTQLIAQVDFVLDGQPFCYRAEKTGVNSIMVGVDDSEATADTLAESLSNQINVGAELSGMYYQWKLAGMTIVGDYDAVFGLNKGKQGFISWLDEDTGILYCLSTTKGCTQELLQNTADLVVMAK